MVNRASSYKYRQAGNVRSLLVIPGLIEVLQLVLIGMLVVGYSNLQSRMGDDYRFSTRPPSSVQRRLTRQSLLRGSDIRTWLEYDLFAHLDHRLKRLAFSLANFPTCSAKDPFDKVISNFRFPVEVRGRMSHEASP